VITTRTNPRVLLLAGIALFALAVRAQADPIADAFNAARDKGAEIVVPPQPRTQAPAPTPQFAEKKIPVNPPACDSSDVIRVIADIFQTTEAYFRNVSGIRFEEIGFLDGRRYCRGGIIKYTVSWVDHATGRFEVKTDISGDSHVWTPSYVPHSSANDTLYSRGGYSAIPPTSIDRAFNFKR